MGFYKGASHYKSCNTEIYWLKDKDGNDVPVDAVSVDLPLVGKPPVFDRVIMTSHRETCPNRCQDRKG